MFQKSKGFSLGGSRIGNRQSRRPSEGEHVVRIEECAMFVSKQTSQPCFRASFTTLESTVAGDVGGRFSFTRGFVDQYGYDPADIAEFIVLVASKLLPGEDVASSLTSGDEKYLHWIAAEDGEVGHGQPAKGLVMNLTTFERQSKNSDRSKLMYEWSLADEGGQGQGSVPAGWPANMPWPPEAA